MLQNKRVDGKFNLIKKVAMNEYLKGKIFNNENKSFVKKMEAKLTIIIDLIDNKTNSDHIFSNYKIYLRVVNLLEKIDKLWHRLKNHSDNMEYTYFTLINIEDIIGVNKKYYGESTY